MHITEEHIWALCRTLSMDEIHGGGPWAPGTFAGPDGSRMPSELELKVATNYGR